MTALEPIPSWNSASGNPGAVHGKGAWMNDSTLSRVLVIENSSRIDTKEE
jgi:hypothetical protein